MGQNLKDMGFVHFVRMKNVSAKNFDNLCADVEVRSEKFAAC